MAGNKIRQARYYARHGERLRERARQIDATPEGKAAKTARHSRERFGGLREAVLERDEYRCTACGHPWEEGSRRIVVHHLDHDRTNNTLVNLMTMCRSCHPKIHGSSRPWQAAKIGAALREGYRVGRFKNGRTVDEVKAPAMAATLRRWQRYRAAKAKAALP